jgi:hypothetical protein
MEFKADNHQITGVACCFCDQPIESGEVDPVELTITAQANRPRTDGFGIQTLWSHAACLDSSGLSDLHVTRPEYWESIDVPGS